MHVIPLCTHALAQVFSSVGGDRARSELQLSAVDLSGVPGDTTEKAEADQVAGGVSTLLFSNDVANTPRFVLG